MSADQQGPDYKPELRHLGKSIDDLLPVLWKTDTSSQLSQLLNIVAQARTLGDEGFDLVMGLAEKLRSLRAFDDLYVLASEMNAVGLATRKSRLYEIQALIELGVFETALDLVRPLLVNDLKASPAGEAYGHLGRIYKQMYVHAEAGAAHVESEVKRLYLERSFNAYMYAWERMPHYGGTWHGVNALAMAHLAARKGFTQSDPKLPQLARTIIDLAAAQRDDVWAQATLGEALLAVEDYEGASAAYVAFAGHQHVTPFTIGAALRQVQEIWGLSGADEKRGKPVRVLKAGMLAKLSAFARVAKLSPREAAKVTALEVRLLPDEAKLLEADLRAKLPPEEEDQAARDMQTLKEATKEELPNLIGINKPISQRIVLRKLERSASVCRIETRIDGTWRGIGTGFAIAGHLLDPEWEGHDVIVTNNHVISAGGCVHSHKAENSRAVFARADETEQGVEFTTVLWEAEHTAHDISVLGLKSTLPTGAKAITTLSRTPLGEKAENDDGIGSCYLIGYPHGAELCFSLSDNVLLDHDGPDDVVFEEKDGRTICVNAPATPVRLHYRTPTTRGSSGSPVFDAVGIELIGVHHAGRHDMGRLNRRGGYYAANEGIWIESIRKAIIADASETALESALVADRGHGYPSGRRAPPAHRHEEPLIGVALEAAALSSAGLIPAEMFKGSSGAPRPGLSRAAKDLLFKPGRASEADIAAARLGLETVIGRDNRTRVTDTDMSPWRMICSIRVTRGELTNVGTGFMIGPRTMLTAGHVLVSPDNPNLPTRVQVIPGLNGESMPYRSHSAERFSVHPKWSKEFSPACDVAMIHLGQDLGCEIGWFRVDARAPSEMIGNWIHVTGYPGEKREPRAAAGAMKQAAQLWHHAAPIDRFDVGRVFYRVDTTEGQSGAPIYVLDEDLNYAIPTVLGIHAYGTKGTPGSRTPANSGVWFNPAILEFIAKNLNS